MICTSSLAPRDFATFFRRVNTIATMTWALLAPTAAGSIRPSSFDLPNEGIAHIVLTASIIGVVRPPLHNAVLNTELGRISRSPLFVHAQFIRAKTQQL